MATEARKKTALAFLDAAKTGRDKDEWERFVTPDARHHNAYFPAGMEALTDAMAQAAKDQPEHTLDVQRVVAEEDTVVVHSHFKRGPDDRGAAVVHIFRFEDDKIAEFWDFGQPVPEDSPNADGMF